jgi:hypothetical protein
MSDTKKEEEEVADDGTFEEIDFDDVEEEVENKGRRPDSFIDIFADFFGGVNYKIIFFLFAIFMFINSDIFIEKVLNRFDGAVEGRATVTNRGTIISGIMLILFYMTFDMLIRNRIV